MRPLDQYRRFFAFGCSFTAYNWPTWADIIAQEIPESYNYGQSGGGNLFIACQVMEAHRRYQFNHDDLVMIMWSSVTREDRYIKGYWLTPGNIYTQGYYNKEFVEDFADFRGYLIRDLAMIALTKSFLDGLAVDYEQLSMVPLTWVQDQGLHMDPVDDVMALYSSTVKSIRPDIWTLELNRKWMSLPITHGTNQTADYHPSTDLYFGYLRKLFPKIKFKPSTVRFVKEHEQFIQSAKDISEFQAVWQPQRPPRL